MTVATMRTRHQPGPVKILYPDPPPIFVGFCDRCGKPLKTPVAVIHGPGGNEVVHPACRNGRRP